MADKQTQNLDPTTPTLDDVTVSFDYTSPTELKKTTWQLVRDLFKTYFDTIYQAVLVSGTNIKTVNGNTLLGSGDIVVSGGASTLDSLTDVVIATPTTGQALVYDGTQWENTTLPGGGDALTTNPLSQFASTTSAQLATVISDETGTGSLVFANSPTLVAPTLGTPASGTLTNCTGGATTAEINTGTANKPMPIDQFVASNRNVRYFDIYAIEKTTDNAVGTNIIGAIECPFTGTITEIGAYVETAGVTGASVWDVNKNGTTIMTTNKLSIDSAEVSTRTATTAPTLTTTAITAGDLITIDTDSLSTTKPKGLHVRIGIRLS